MKKVNQFNPRIFWDTFLTEKNLFSLYYQLNHGLHRSILDLSSPAKFEDTPGAELSRLKWILQKRENQVKPGIELIENIYDARKTLINFFILSKRFRNQNKKIKPENLENNRLDYKTFLKTLKQVSVFWAWGYNLQVPDEIQQLYKTVGNTLPNIPEDELALLNITDLTNNNTPRFPVIFIIDNNICMGEDDSLYRIEQGMNDLFEEIRGNRLLSWSAELCIFSCGGGPKLIANFGTIDTQESNLNNMDLQPYGTCKMGDTINQALFRLEERLVQMSNPDVSIDWYRPWLIILSNGRFFGDISESVSHLHEMTEKRDLQVYVRALSPTADMGNLYKISSDVQLLTSVNGFFADVFKSMQMCSHSIPGGERVHLINELGFIDNRKY